jgi:hypothetical protein
MQTNRVPRVVREDHRDFAGGVRLVRRVSQEDATPYTRPEPGIDRDRCLWAQLDHVTFAQPEVTYRVHDHQRRHHGRGSADAFASVAPASSAGACSAASWAASVAQRSWYMAAVAVACRSCAWRSRTRAARCGASGSGAAAGAAPCVSAAVEPVVAGAAAVRSAAADPSAGAAAGGRNGASAGSAMRKVPPHFSAARRPLAIQRRTVRSSTPQRAAASRGTRRGAERTSS